jgi:hypothetical protein
VRGREGWGGKKREEAERLDEGRDRESGRAVVAVQYGITRIMLTATLYSPV